MASSDEKLIRQIRESLHTDEDRRLAPRATRTREARRRKREDSVDSGYRMEFSLDTDRILHSRAYTRYIDKTQVFYLIRNDHITHRVLHVQLVSKVARTIGRFLNLNEDLIEAVSLGHDIGHAPFGHDGETFLSEICAGHGIGAFLHNAQSVQFLDRVERQGRGWNLCLQTLDGILCHDGEVHNQFLTPDPHRSFDDLARTLEEKKKDPRLALTPMTAEGCVVRMADTIAYIGRDIDDAVRLGLVKRSEVPAECCDILGDTNGTIVHRLVTDIITQSRESEHIAFSEPVSEALRKLKAFNLAHIYTNAFVKQHRAQLQDLFRLLFNRYLTDLEKQNRDSVIYTRFLSDKCESYEASHKKEEIVRDFIAGMTDQYFLLQCPEEKRPQMALLP